MRNQHFSALHQGAGRSLDTDLSDGHSVQIDLSTLF